MASHLVHPNITTIYNFGELPQGHLFIAMEYVEGPLLSAVLEEGPLPTFVAVDLAFQLVQALAYAHD